MWSDVESEKDYLNFGEVSQLAVDVLNSPGMLPVSIGVFGNWGAGKSSLLKLIESQLVRENQNCIIVKFDAWLHQGYDDVRAALLEVIATKFTETTKENEGLLEKAKRLLNRVNDFRILGIAAEGTALLTGIPTGGMLFSGISSLSDKTRDEKAGKQARNEAEESLKPLQHESPPQQIEAFRKEYGEILEALNKPLIVIIDNLDRCLPSNAIHTLEAIRLFLFLKNTAFIIAADEEMIRSSVVDYFKGASDRHQIDYLDKLIQIPIRVPKAGVREIRSYLFMLYAIDYGLSEEKLESLRTKLEENLQQSWKNKSISHQDALALTGESEEGHLAQAYERADRISPILANSPIIHGNPRIVKRLLNVVKMRSNIANRRSIPLDEAIITKLVIFERCAGAEATADFYRLVDKEKGKPVILKLLEKEPLEDFPSDAPKNWINNPTTKDFILEWAQLEPALADVDLRAAIYLSRETMPIGIYTVNLSPSGQEALKTLLNTRNISSPAANNVLDNLPFEEQVPVMQGVISYLRQVSDWNKQPKGFAGGCLLAQRSENAARIFRRFIAGLELGKRQPPWLTTLLKSERWYKEA